MQALCQWEVQGDASSRALAEFLAAQDASPETTAYATALVQTFWGQQADIDPRITVASIKWDLARISPVDRNIMRVAIVELLGVEIPAKVVLDEAIEIGREYGGEESPRFINGVLDAVFQEIQATAGKDE